MGRDGEWDAGLGHVSEINHGEFGGLTAIWHQCVQDDY